MLCDLSSYSKFRYFHLQSTSDGSNVEFFYKEKYQDPWLGLETSQSAEGILLFKNLPNLDNFSISVLKPSTLSQQQLSSGI